MDHYGLIGNPVSHSLSEKYFTDKFILEGIDARFERFLLKDIDALPGLLDSYPTLRGLSVTSPFKTEVIRFCDEVDQTASSIRAANTLFIKKDQGRNIIKGYNTDADGFAAALIPLLGRRKPDALILGSGGAARAVAYALNRLGIRFNIVSRTPGPGKKTYDELSPRMISERKLIINATPLGLPKYRDRCPDISYKHISGDHLLFDLIYNPADTPFLKKGKSKGAMTENGLIMLQAQAEKAWNIWNSDI